MHLNTYMYIRKREQAVFALRLESLKPAKTCFFKGLNNWHKSTTVGVVVVAADGGGDEQKERERYSKGGRNQSA